MSDYFCTSFAHSGPSGSVHDAHSLSQLPATSSCLHLRLGVFVVHLLAASSRQSLLREGTQRVRVAASTHVAVSRTRPVAPPARAHLRHRRGQRFLRVLHQHGIGVPRSATQCVCSTERNRHRWRRDVLLSHLQRIPDGRVDHHGVHHQPHETAQTRSASGDALKC